MFKSFYLKEIFGEEPIRGTRLTKENRVPGDIPLVTAGEQNEGIAEYISNEENLTLKNMLTIDMFGNCFYRDYPYKSDDNILSFGLDDKSTEEMLYVASVINNICKKQYSYSKQYRKGSYLETIIPLPVIKNPNPYHEYTVEDINWQYMRERIKELERERIKELDAYLKVTGLNDYELNDEDKAILCISDEKYIEDFVGDVIWKKVKISDMFDIHPTKSYKMTNDELFKTKGKVPVLSNSSNNNGIAGRVSLSPTEEGNIITFSDTTTGPNTIFYQAKPFIGYSHIQGMYPLVFELDEKIAEYIIPVIRKSVGDGFNYARKFTREIVSNTEIELPFDSNGNLHKLYIYIYTSYRKNNYQRNDSLERPSIRDIARNCVKTKKFLLKNIAILDNGNKFDKNKMTYNNPTINFVSRTAANNGVSDFVDNNGTSPYRAGCITLAFGGSIGSCFVQYNPFYTGQNVGVIDFGDNVSSRSKQYIALCLGKYCQTMFTAFADEINKHFKKDLSVTLPSNLDGTPDFEYMEKYIRAIEKLVIKDVIIWKDKIIETTRNVVEGDW